MKELSKEDANALLNDIKLELEATEDAGDFCLWLADELKKRVGARINLETKSTITKIES